MTAEPEHQHVPVCYRNLGTITLDEQDATIEVDHVYIREGAVKCDDCGAPGHDPGEVGLILATGDGETARVIQVLLAPEVALTLANRLTRGANLILESEEDVPDMEREAARYGGVPADPGGISGQERGAA
jgi:hypothetical protein